MALLQEYGLSQRDAASLYADLYASGAGNAAARPPCLSMSQLAARLERWQRVLPGLNVASMAAADSQLLHADISDALRSLITLVAWFPGRYAATIFSSFL
jgi:hypothetical protein